MTFWIAVFALVMIAATSARSENVVRRVPAEKTTNVFTYRSWQPSSCASVGGTVKILVKPKHGRLASRGGLDVRVVRNRVNPTDARCAGMPVKGFAVDYTPKPGYRGTDEFIIEFTPAAGGKLIDNFTVVVE